MKRMVLVLSVALMMAAMMLVMAAPAFAKGKPPGAGPSDAVCEFLLFDKQVFPSACAA